MNDKPQSAHGGQRPGAGRKPQYDEPMSKKTVTLARRHVLALREYGDGNLSRGIRLLVEKYLLS
jgi:hypothetical protein